MRIAYFQCFSGISGDMVLGALLNAGLDFRQLGDELKKLALDGYKLEQSRVMRGGLSATKLDVISTEERRISREFQEILKIIDLSSLQNSVKEMSKKIFTCLASAEATVHGTTVNEVHFHEVGALDAIVDVVGCATALELMGIEKVFSSPINVGGGMVQTSHGLMPVPVPAVVELLKGNPVYSAGPQVELTTPTGAAILSALASGFGTLPPMVLKTTGFGAGSSDFLEMPNLLRVFIGIAAGEEDVDTVTILEANIDDMNPELYSPFMEKALGAGALDVFLTPIMMKKGRPATKITVLAEPSREQELATLLFRETTSFGVRMRYEVREKLKRETVEVETPYGKVKVKIGKMGGRITQISPEADVCADIAARKKVPLKLVYDEAKKAAMALEY